MITEQNIQDVKNKIVEKFNPEKIVLFGSYANGNATEDSDLDLLIILKSDLPRQDRRVPIRRNLREFKFPMDLLIYTPEEIEYWKEIPMAFINQVVKEGKIIYE